MSLKITDPNLQALAAECNAALEHCPEFTRKLLAASIQGRIEHQQAMINSIPPTPIPDTQGPG